MKRSADGKNSLPKIIIILFQTLKEVNSQYNVQKKAGSIVYTML